MGFFDWMRSEKVEEDVVNQFRVQWLKGILDTVLLAWIASPKELTVKYQAMLTNKIVDMSQSEKSPVKSPKRKRATASSLKSAKLRSAIETGEAKVSFLNVTELRDELDERKLKEVASCLDFLKMSAGLSEVKVFPVGGFHCVITTDFFLEDHVWQLKQFCWWRIDVLKS